MNRWLEYGVSRREFLKQLGWLGLSGSTFFGYAQAARQSEQIKNASAQPASRIVIVQKPGVVRAATEERYASVQRMLDTAMVRLTGAANTQQAWRSLFTSDDIVGIKLNCLAGKALSSRPEVIQAITTRLREIGIPGRHIILWERSNRELNAAGYPINRDGNDIRCYGTDDKRAGYGKQVIAGSVISRLSKIVTNHCTALINVPILKDHNIAGVTASMKNWYGAIHNPNKYHSNHGDPFIADLSTIPMIRNKMRLIVCDALRALYEGGPSYHPGGVWAYNGLLVGTDPVALDQTAGLIIEERRREAGIPSLEAAGRPPRYIATATQRGLGTNDPARMEVVKIGI